jgi:hypothetical protein
MTGCATQYATDRRRDAADIFTVVLGGGAGGSARVGPIQAGLLLQFGELGLRGGEVSPGSLLTGQSATTVIPFGVGDNSITGMVFGLEQYTPRETGQTRGKGFKAVSRFPFLTTELRPSTVVDLGGRGQRVFPGPYPLYYCGTIIKTSRQPRSARNGQSDRNKMSTSLVRVDAATTLPPSGINSWTSSGVPDWR